MGLTSFPNLDRDYIITLRMYEAEKYVSIEYLYQQFKERLLEELKEATNERHEG